MCSDNVCRDCIDICKNVRKDVLLITYIITYTRDTTSQGGQNSKCI